jgi:hypothetical protein
MSTSWCLECGVKGEPTPAAVILGREEMCLAHARAAGYSQQEIDDARIVAMPAPIPAPRQEQTAKATPRKETPEQTTSAAEDRPESFLESVLALVAKPLAGAETPREIETMTRAKAHSRASRWCTNCKKALRKDSKSDVCRACRTGVARGPHHKGKRVPYKKATEPANGTAKDQMPCDPPLLATDAKPALATLLVSEAQLVRMFAGLPIEEKALVLQMYLREAES